MTVLLDYCRLELHTSGLLDMITGKNLLWRKKQKNTWWYSFTLQGYIKQTAK